MTPLVPTRDHQADNRARHLFPLSGRRGACQPRVTTVRQERPVDTIAVARKLAEGTA
jgi:hypothetical protein